MLLYRIRSVLTEPYVTFVTTGPGDPDAGEAGCLLLVYVLLGVSVS